ncbi:uncharacterized protein TNCT_56131 [Trichonephila clavata]|uniref:Uncharacterized protein n=1 Tax=Trichonephila clavata TaxID=2740835 RepID=A0A8X6KTW7_TRICU|nr:uncharacterized protein TNCT_56131 [Trichonephila clavata]
MWKTSFLISNEKKKGVSHSTSYPSMKNYEGRPSFSPVYSGAPTSPRTGDTSSSLGPWNRVGSKDYYKMNGYTLKSTSATKRALDPSAIPQGKHIIPFFIPSVMNRQMVKEGSGLLKVILLLI